MGSDERFDWKSEIKVIPQKITVNKVDTFDQKK